MQYVEEKPDKTILYSVRYNGFFFCCALYFLRNLVMFPISLLMKPFGVKILFGDKAFLRFLSKLTFIWASKEIYPAGTKFTYIPRTIPHDHGLTFLSGKLPSNDWWL